MARVPYRSRDGLPEGDRVIFDNLAAERGGEVANLFRALAHSPVLLRDFVRMGGDIRFKTTLDPKLRELAIMTVGRLCESAIEWVSHAALARKAGVSEEQILALPVWRRHAAFSEQEKAVIGYAEQVTRDVRVTGEAWAGVHAFLNDEELVELTLSIAYYNMVVRFLEPMEIDLDDAYRR
ncbi:MAG: carboxymuconolactone decarboxylase family protein [Chloroflexi bacterium]|nr:carboxymuconolactone decarboxylase family protein [Chloroflexota bacterium]